MTPEQILKELKEIKEPRYEVWSFPLRLGPEDALAAELIEIAMARLGENATGADLLNVSSTMFWWCMTHLSLGEREQVSEHYQKKSSEAVQQTLPAELLTARASSSIDEQSQPAEA